MTEVRFLRGVREEVLEEAAGLCDAIAAEHDNVGTRRGARWCADAIRSRIQPLTAGEVAPKVPAEPNPLLERKLMEGLSAGGRGESHR